MIEKNFTYKCKCSKCSHEWNTRKDALPDRCAGCNVTGWNSDYVEPEAKPKLSLEDRVRELPTDKRLDLFAQFELCCGMNLGACICPEEIIAPVQIAAPVQGERLSIDQLKALIAPIENGVTTLSSIHAQSQIAPALITEDWRFTKDNPQYDDNGRVYRQQYLAPLGKRRRSVEVDADDLEMIIER